MVGIVVDQLRTDYIEYLQSYFGERGFNTLLRDGAYIRDVDFRAPVADMPTASAMLFTGSYPSETGVPASAVYDSSVAGSGLRPPLAKPSASGAISNDSFTPEALRLSTVADELVIDSDGASAVYSVAVDPQQAVIMAGHAGKGAYWINNTSGNWATTSYYGSLPATLSNRNMRRALSHRIDTMRWVQSPKVSGIPMISGKSQVSPFKYTFRKQDRDVYRKFAQSPLANAEVTDVAIDLIRDFHLGSRPDETDMLNIGYTLAPYKDALGTGKAELVDSYLRLDSQLARLFDAIDRSVGRGNAVIWLSSTGYYDDAIIEEKRYRIPSGEFSVKRAISLLNSYLSARHGSASYIGAIRNGQVWFDRKSIEDRRLDADEVISDARNFLVKMSGVADAYTISDILSPSTETEQNLRLATDPSVSGDILIRYAPGWTVVDDDQIPAKKRPVRESPVMTPAFLLAPGVTATRIDDPVSAASLAPTVTGALRIRSPNGSRERGIPLK